jgi:hypothetical protein
MPRNLQQAADDVGVIAETVETLIKLLDRFHANHHQQYEKLVAAWPNAESLNAKPLYDFAKKLTPPEDE